MADKTRSITETEFNSAMREALRSQGYRVLHIREADITGVADLIVYKMISGYQRIYAWLEIKVRDDKNYSGIPRPAQFEFMRDHWRLGRNSFFVTLDLRDPLAMITISQGDDWDGESKIGFTEFSPAKIAWVKVFQHNLKPADKKLSDITYPLGD